MVVEVLFLFEEKLKSVSPRDSKGNLLVYKAVVLSSDSNCRVEILLRNVHGDVLIEANEILIVKPELQTRAIRRTPEAENETLDIEILVFR